jgi:plasmid replication initiation protein
MKKQILSRDGLIEKRNILNEMRSNSMTLQELRFFSIYLSKINARDPDGTRLVRFELSEFRRIMELQRAQEKDIRYTIDSLLTKVVHVPIKKGGYDAFQLFKKCRVSLDGDGIWYVEINAHDDALPLMFDFKDKYFTYKLWNALRLKSSNQLRMYELLKQYEKLGERVIALEDLRLWIGIEAHEYPRWIRFREKVLDACQRALAEHTDIKFDYEPIRKGIGKGTGRKITHIKFIIKKNEDYSDQLSLGDFIEQQPGLDIVNEDPLEQYEEHLRFVAEACNFEFPNVQIQIIFNLLAPIPDPLKKFRVVKTAYDRLKMYEGSISQNRFGYFEKIVTTEVEKLSRA